MDASSYFASYFGWVTFDDYFVGGLFVCVAIFLFLEIVFLVSDQAWSWFKRDRREKICQVHHSQRASEPCHFRSCPAVRYCSHYQKLSFKERVAWAFGTKKKKP